MSDQLSSFEALVLSRRSLRAYEDRPVPKEVLIKLLTCAIWAPSAHNRQPWRFAVITDKAMHSSLALAMGARLRADLEADNVSQEHIDKDTSRSYQRITSAPVLICLCMSMVDMDQYPDPKRSEAERLMAVQSTAMAGQNLLLAAHAAGLGACWMCAPLFCPDAVVDVLNLPNDWQPQALITLGYPTQVRSRSRESLEKRVVWR